MRRDSRGTLAIAATTWGIRSRPDSELFDASIVPNHFFCQRAKSLGVGAAKHSPARDHHSAFLERPLPIFRAGRGWGWRRGLRHPLHREHYGACLLLGPSPRNIIILRHPSTQHLSTTRNTPHVTCLMNSLPSGFFIGGRMRPRLPAIPP
jgi:hypothetical protein